MTDTQRMERVRGYLQLGMGAEALEELDGMDLAGHEPTETLILRMLACRMVGRWTEMQETARALMRRAPREPEFWVLLADATRHAESLQNGLSILEIAEELFPLHSHLLFQKGCYHCQLGQVKEAKEYVEKAVALDKTWAVHARRDRDLAPLWRANETSPTDTSTMS